MTLCVRWGTRGTILVVFYIILSPLFRVCFLSINMGASAPICDEIEALRRSKVRHYQWNIKAPARACLRKRENLIVWCKRCAVLNLMGFWGGVAYRHWRESSAPSWATAPYRWWPSFWRNYVDPRPKDQY